MKCPESVLGVNMHYAQIASQKFNPMQYVYVTQTNITFNEGTTTLMSSSVQLSAINLQGKSLSE